MLLEPSRPRLSHRARSALLSSEPTRGRLRVRLRSPDAPPPPLPPPAPPAEVDGPPSHGGIVVPMPRAVLLAAALTLAATSRGDVVVLALLLGFGAGRRWSGLAAAAALGAALVRWGSPALGAIAGAQAVLGPAGWTGSPAAVASAWLGALALVLAAAPLDSPHPIAVAASVAPFSIAPTDVAVGPAPGGALAPRLLATAAALVLTTALARRRSMPWIAVASGLLALFFAGIAR